MSHIAEENHIFPFLWMRGEEESILRNEIQKIHECGIGAVCVEARPHEGFCQESWWHDMDIVIDEAKKNDMKIWILDDKHFPTGYANGLIEKKYPERKKLYINSTAADVFGGRHLQTLEIGRMLRPTIGFWEIGKPANEEERAKNELLGIVAIRFAQGNLFAEEMIDLTDKYDGTYVNFELPEGQWRVHVIYKTRTDGGDESYINLIDRQSAYTQIEGVYEPHFRQYKEEFGKTIAGFFSDEPQFGNIKEVGYDTKLGKAKMPLPWSDELQSMMEAKYGEGFRKYLPYLFEESAEKKLGVQIRFDYMDFVSELYRKNFSCQIGEWCAAHGVEYIGHVVEDNGVHSRLGMGAAHYFRAMDGQHMAGIDCIGGQVVYGAPNQTRKGMTDIDGEFCHYVLGKLGASCGQLDPKKKGRTMCELFGAYGWKFGVRDMKYLLDHFLVKGINYLVPHAFSMAEYPDMDCPPHFYARGNNPEFPYFAELMKYGNRMCRLLSNGLHHASVAVLYDGEADWSGDHMPMQKVCRQLLENQIDFNIVSTDMLADLRSYNGEISGNLLRINGMSFESLIIPYTEQINTALDQFIEQSGDLPVIYVDQLPEKVIGKENYMTRSETVSVVSLEGLADSLKVQGIYDIRLDQKFKELSFYHYEKDTGHIFVFQNESAEQAFYGKVSIPVRNEIVYYDAFTETYTTAEQTETAENGYTEIVLELEPGECCVLMERGGVVCSGAHKSYKQQQAECQNTIALHGWKISSVKAKDYPAFKEEGESENLESFSVQHPSFSGVLRYETELNLEAVPERAYLEAEHVYEVMKLTVNGKQTGICLRPPYQLDITKYLVNGTNNITIEAATSPARDQMNYPRPPFDFTHETMEPTGVFGEVKVMYR